MPICWVTSQTTHFRAQFMTQDFGLHTLPQFTNVLRMSNFKPLLIGGLATAWLAIFLHLVCLRLSWEACQFQTNVWASAALHGQSISRFGTNTVLVTTQLS